MEKIKQNLDLSGLSLNIYADEKKKEKVIFKARCITVIWIFFFHS